MVNYNRLIENWYEAYFEKYSESIIDEWIMNFIIKEFYGFIPLQKINTVYTPYNRQLK